MSESPDLERFLREGQDRLRGRPQTWWEKNEYRVQAWAITVVSVVGVVIAGIGAAAWGFVVYHFITKFW